jgi:RNA methyltransferase, TrmH family
LPHDESPALEPITSRANARLKHARKLQARRYRRLLGQFMAEGEDLVEEAMAAGILPVETLIAADRPPDEGLVARLARGGPVHAVKDALLAEVGGLGHPSRVIGIYAIDSLPREYPAPGAGYSPLAVYLHRVIDPGNVGTVVRACGALGPARLVLSPGCSDPLAGKGVRASMGAVFRVPINTGAEVPAEGRRIALVAGAREPLWEADLTGPVTLVVGAERHGLPDDLVASCEGVAAIPQAAGSESLNAAQAASLALYEAVRQRAQAASRNGG